MTENKRKTDQRTRRRRRQKPLDIRMSFVVRTGDEPEDVVTIMDDHEMKMVGSVFQYRDQAARFLAMSLVKVAATNRKVFLQVVPGLKNLMKSRR